jgi:hypothetical protein
LPRLKVIGAVFVLPLYVFMAWIGITWPLVILPIVLHGLGSLSDWEGM